MARTKRIIKFKTSIEYNFVFFGQEFTIYSTKNKKSHDGGAQNPQEWIKLKLIS